MKNRTLCVLLILTMLFALCSCGENSESYPLSVNGTGINSEIFTYYLDEAFNSDDGGTTRDERINYATNMCIRYVALNSTVKQMELELTPAEKANCSDESNALWEIYRTHYEKLGVGKETFIKLHLSDAYREKLRLYLYDKDGTSPISDDALKSYFYENYVAVKVISGYLYTYDVYGNESAYTDEEKQEIEKTYTEACSKINNGLTIDFIYPSLSADDDSASDTLNTEVITESTPYYPAGFYEKARSLDVGKSGVFVFDDYIYLVYRENILGDSSLLDDYRSECLTAVSEAPLKTEIDRMCNAYKSVRNTDEVNKCYSVTEEVFSSEKQ